MNQGLLLGLQGRRAGGNAARIVKTIGGRVVSKQKRNTLTAAPFRVGDKVRVKHGFMDVDYPDMPLGGWVGTVTERQCADTFTRRCPIFHSELWRAQAWPALAPILSNAISLKSERSSPTQWCPKDLLA